MKIIHTGDLHLDSAMRSHLSKDIAKERKEELFKAFQNVVSYANENKIPVIILAGDVFDSDKATKGTKTSFLALIKKNPDIDFIYTLGNHDESTFNFEAEEIPSNLYIGSDNWQSKAYKDVTITYINFNDNTEKILYNTLKLNDTDKNIVVLHGETTDFSENGKIQLKKLKNKNIDYLALGHIHMNSNTPLDERGVYVYCGCLEGRGFDEEGPKGFYVVDTDDIKNPNFIVNSKRIVYKKEVSLDGCSHWLDYEDKVKEALKDVTSNDIVEIIIVGKYSIDLNKNVDGLLRELKEKYYFAKVKDNSKLLINPKDYENDPSFKGQFIKMVSESSDFSDDEKNEIIEIGIHALIGDEF